jgi:hypothetical protein
MNDTQGKDGILNPVNPRLGKTHITKGKQLVCFDFYNFISIDDKS